MKVVLFGSPSAGKGTQGRFLSDRFKIPHISTGQIFRDNMARHTPLGEEVREVMEAGEFCTDELTNRIVIDTISKLNGYILDGYPRTLPQALFFDDYCKTNHNTIDAYLYLKVPQDIVIERMIASNRFEQDTPEKIQTRLGIFRNITMPCVKHFSWTGDLFIIHNDTIEHISSNLEKLLMSEWL